MPFDTQYSTVRYDTNDHDHNVFWTAFALKLKTTYGVDFAREKSNQKAELKFMQFTRSSHFRNGIVVKALMTNNTLA